MRTGHRGDIVKKFLLFFVTANHQLHLFAHYSHYGRRQLDIAWPNALEQPPAADAAAVVAA
jgi:hypothetical protein